MMRNGSMLLQVAIEVPHRSFTKGVAPIKPRPAKRRSGHQQSPQILAQCIVRLLRVRLGGAARLDGRLRSRRPLPNAKSGRCIGDPSRTPRARATIAGERAGISGDCWRCSVLQSSADVRLPRAVSSNASPGCQNPGGMVSSSGTGF